MTSIESIAKTALITGATGGLGEEFARIFARGGYELVLVARNEQKLEVLAKQLNEQYGVVATAFACDLSEEGAAARVAGFTEQENIDVDVLVNNAGFGDYGMFAASDLSKQTEMVNVDVRALTELTYWYLGPMIERGYGKVLNIGSIASFMPGPFMPTYFASKAYVLSFTESISEELKGTGVSCTVLCPGPISTAFWNKAGTDNSGFLLGSTKYATAQEVAEYGYKSLMEGKVVAIHGTAIKAAAFGVRFLPRCVVRSIVAKVLEQRQA